MATPHNVPYTAISENARAETTPSLNEGRDGAESKKPVTSFSQADVTPAKWHISPWAPFSMLALFISGILISVGHHLFYSRLHGTTVRNVEDGASEFVTQVWIIRYGTAFAFLAKTLLASAVVVAYKQHMWVNLRNSAMSISTINAVFAATHDFVDFLNPNFVRKATAPAFMALVTWCLPLAALISPSTLLVVPSMSPTTQMRPIPTLDMTNDSLYKFTYGFGDGSAPLVTRITAATASGMEVLPMKAGISNSTYQDTFEGYSLRCESSDLENQVLNSVWNETVNSLGDQSSKELRYLAFTGDNLSAATNYTIANVTTFVSKCVGTVQVPCEPALGPIIWARAGNDSTICSLYNTTYNLRFDSSDTTQGVSLVSFRWEKKTSEGGFFPGVALVLSRALATLLNGYIAVIQPRCLSCGMRAYSAPPPQLVTSNTRIMDTALIGLITTGVKSGDFEVLPELPEEERALPRNRSLGEMIEELSRNQTLSLFSNERFWLSEGNSSFVNVTSNSFYTIYEYRPLNLVLAYGIAIAFSAAGVILGFRALWINGVSHDNDFYSIMATTRNSYLDELTLGHSLGAAPVPESIAKTKLRFGELANAPENTNPTDGRVRAGFGLVDSTLPLRKGQDIY